MIKEITDAVEIADCAGIIREAFKTVADRFNLTVENCPTHPSFISNESLIALKEKGVRMFGLYESGVLVGFVAVEKADSDVYYLEKLAVGPRWRRKKYGVMLVQFIIDRIKRNNGKIVSIGIIDEDSALKRWYESIGFREREKKKYDHLPFTVCLMEYKI